MKILVLWSDPEAPNLGVQALANGARLLAQASYPNADVEYATFGGSPEAYSLGARMCLRDATRVDPALRNQLIQYDLVLDTGAGDSFTDIYGHRRLATILYVRQAARRLGIPVVIAPQTIGPFRSRVARHLAARSLQSADLVLTRDSVSASLVHSWGISNVVESSDLVFALGTEKPYGDHDIILNVSGLLWHENPHVNHVHYRASITTLVRGLQERGRRVTALPHVLSNSSVDDDSAILPDVATIANEVATPNDLREARAIIGGAQLVIGARMHACLNSLSQGVPAIPWAYSRKFTPLLADLGWANVVELQSAQGEPAVETLALIDGFGPQMSGLAGDVRKAGVLRLSRAQAALSSLKILTGESKGPVRG